MASLFKTNSHEEALAYQLSETIVADNGDVHYINKIISDDELCFDYVDLGLSVNWATCNLFAKEPTQLGKGFSFAGDIPCDINIYDSDNKYYNKNNYVLGGYQNKSDYLKQADDAARKYLGYRWRIPTQKEWQELFENCTVIKNSEYYTFTSKIPGYTDKSIIIPYNKYRLPDSAGQSLCYILMLDFIWNRITADKLMTLPIRPICK